MEERSENKVVQKHRSNGSFLCNLNSEFEFALFSLECGFPVRLAKRPDMYLEEIPVDVKSLSYDPSNPIPKYVRKMLTELTERSKDNMRN